MATLDLLEQKGVKGANFLSLGGQAYHEKIMESLVLVDNDPNVGCIFVNMFCAMLSAEKLALVLRDCYTRNYLSKPTVVRVKGYKSEEAIEILQEANMPMVHVENDLDKALDLVIKLS